MNAYQLHEAAFDSACDHAEDTVEYIDGYADGAFGITLPTGVAEAILAARQAWREAADEDGQGQHHHHHLIRVPLEEIEIGDAA